MRKGLTNLGEVITKAELNKPPTGDSCNHCGWCCLTEVCGVGVGITGSKQIPCTLLDERDGKYYC